MESSDIQWLNNAENISTQEAEAEQEAAWLRAVGMDSAVEKFEKGEYIDKHTVKQQLSFLTSQQRIAVQKRVQTLNRTLRKRRRTIRSDTEVLYGSAATGAARDLPNYNAENETGKQSCVDTYHENPPPPLKCQTSFIDYDLPLEHNNGAAVPLQTSASPTHQLQSSKFRDYSDHTHPYHHAFNGQQHSQKNHARNLPYSQAAYTHDNQSSNQFDVNSHSHWDVVASGPQDDRDIKELSGLEEDFFELIDADIRDDPDEEEEEEEDHYVEDEETGISPLGEVDSHTQVQTSTLNSTNPLPFRNSPNHSRNPNLLPTRSQHQPPHSIVGGSNKENNDALHANKNGDCFVGTTNDVPRDVADGDVSGVRSSRLLSTGGTFPRVSLASRERKNGITVLYDLSLPDVSRLNTLSFLQLTSIFDQFNIPLSIPKKIPKPHSKASPCIFGRNLTSLVDDEMKRDQYQYILAPRFVKELIKHLINGSLAEEGVLRKAGNSSRIKGYRQLIDQSFNAKPFSWAEVQIHDAASLLKQYLMELPVPILTFEYMHFFPLICKMDCKLSKKLEALNLLVLMLPVAHSHTLKLLLIYLEKVSQNEEHNRMNLENIAKIMAPTFFGGTSFDGGNKFKSSKPLGSMDDEIKNIEDQQEVLQLLIHYHEQLWIIPDFLLSECRHKNQTSNDKQKSVLKNLFKRSMRRESIDQSDSASSSSAMAAASSSAAAPSSAVMNASGVATGANCSNSFLPRQLNVCLSHNTTVYVDTEMCPTVGAVMDYIKRSTGPIHKMNFASTSSTPSTPFSSSSSGCSPGGGGDASSGDEASCYSQDGWMKAINGDPSKKLYLFEMGGNISKRCLTDESASMSKLLSLNPGATWTVEFR